MSIPREHRPALGELVRYRPTAHHGERTAVVVGYPDTARAEDELHLAVLMEDDRRLELLALAVPHSHTAQLGTWSADEANWPVEPVTSDSQTDSSPDGQTDSEPEAEPEVEGETTGTLEAAV